MIITIDTGKNNIGSFIKSVYKIGYKTKVSLLKEDLEEAKAIILPGVGAFGEIMSILSKNNLIETIRNKVIIDKTPILGICLGMQLLSSESEEHGTHKGLDLVKGNVVKLKRKNKNVRVPNIGWCDVLPTRNSILIPKKDEVKSYYHVHSYYFKCKNSNDCVATIKFDEIDIPVIIEKDNIFGTQFHPEKSQDAGLDLLERFFQYLERKNIT